MFLDQYPDQTKQLLMLRSLSRTQEGSNLDVGDMTSEGHVASCLMNTSPETSRIRYQRSLLGLL
ncbi:hypothetical protein BB934_36065 (plasmid) [Microvirga ossetica]|uniref:Uncharacterized protein n=1 Tax=Microvirga ossetica TaxID=1882682 RepID=A0A1B2EUM3_9HYPH|nr:hypothetical protein BB934_36065 [Microvirga ossetica]